MSELKAISSGEIYNIIEYEGSCITDDLYYPKSEADKVIAEKDAEIALLKDKANYNECAYKFKSEELADTCRFYEDELRHQKYKRILDNVWWCRKLSREYAWSASTHRGWKIAGYYSDKAELFRKWHKRWLKIADKFKEA